MENTGFFVCVWCMAFSSLSAFDYSYYEKIIAPAARKLTRNVPDGIMGSFLKYPELIFEPSLEGYDNTVMFVKGRENSFKKYTDKLGKLYQDSSHPTLRANGVVDCYAYESYRPPDQWDKSCRFDPLLDFGEDGRRCSPEGNFGFEDGLPCMMISMDRVYNWIPEPYTNETVPLEISNLWSPAYVTVKCEGADPVSVDNLYDVSVYPSNGFQFQYFPDNGYEHWQRPWVAVSVDTTPGVAVDVKCTIWAANTRHSDLLNTGSVKFTVLVD